MRGASTCHRGLGGRAPAIRRTRHRCPRASTWCRTRSTSMNSPRRFLAGSSVRASPSMRRRRSCSFSASSRRASASTCSCARSPLVSAAGARLVIAGNDMGAESTLRALVRALGIAARVTFAGLLDGRDRLEALADATSSSIRPSTKSSASCRSKRSSRHAGRRGRRFRLRRSDRRDRRRPHRAGAAMSRRWPRRCDTILLITNAWRPARRRRRGSRAAPLRRACRRATTRGCLRDRSSAPRGPSHDGRQRRHSRHERRAVDPRGRSTRCARRTTRPADRDHRRRRWQHGRVGENPCVVLASPRRCRIIRRPAPRRGGGDQRRRARRVDFRSSRRSIRTSSSTRVGSSGSSPRFRATTSEARGIAAAQGRYVFDARARSSRA